MITRIYANNYRAFKNLDIPLSKINLFFGPNNSGKSSILSLLNLLSQTLLSSDTAVPLLLRGTKEDLGTYRDLVHRHNVNSQITLGVQSNARPIHMRPRPSLFGGIGVELTFSYRARRHEIILDKIITKSIKDNLEVHVEKSKSANSSTYYLTKIKKEKEEEIIQKRIEYVEHFIPRLPFSLSDNSKYEEVDDMHRRITRHLTTELKQIEFIGPFRSFPNRLYMFSGENPKSVGVHGERAIDMLTMDHLRRSGKAKKHLVKKISKWFNAAGISENLKIKTLSDRHYEVVLTRTKQKSKENLADVGYGCSQVLPILVAGYSMEKGTLVIQEPEIHLHPKAQAELGTFFYKLANNNIQSIIETHSEHLLLRLQAYISSNKLKKEDIKVYYIYVKKGETKCIEIKLNNNGFFDNKWPEGFFPERYNEAKKIAKGSLKI